MVIAAVIGRRQPPLRVDGPSELAAPDEQRVVQHAALLQILQEAITRLIDVLALARQMSGHVGMDVPAIQPDLDESRAALEQPARRQAALREASGPARVLAVELVHARRLAGEIGQLRHGRLHAIRHLVLRDARQRFRVADRLVLQLVQLAQRIQHSPADGRRHAVGIVDEQHRLGARTQRHARDISPAGTPRSTSWRTSPESASAGCCEPHS